MTDPIEPTEPTEPPDANAANTGGGDGAGNGGGGDDEGGGIIEHAHQISIEQEMRSSYVDYAMSVIVGRALPDVRDGLKPVHRRVLFTQYMMKNNWNSAYKKSARIVGDCIGKYHPHGDSAVYDTLVRMAQDFSLRHPLVDGQGNFGSIDGDPPAAMRYTEVRMTRLAHELLADLEKNTVDFQANYDGHDHEPTVLPSRLPNLLVNGSGGIAVGMATNIPPHNLGEVIDAAVGMVDDPDIEISGLMQHMRGPDFPTGGTIYGREGIHDAYTTGRGKIRVRGKTHFEQGTSGRDVIVIDELPYQVNKARLVEHIASLVRDKKIEGIADLRDESDRHGIRVVIMCKRDAMSEIVLNHLYRLTNLQTTFGVINLAIVGGQPQVLTLRQMLRHFLDHRREVVTRRCLYELEQAEARAHILAGLLIALDDIDRVIELIRASPDRQTASTRLQDAFALSEIQAGAILDMRLARLTGLERDKIKAEFDELQTLIAWLQAVLGDDGQLMGIIRGELLELREQYANPRRTDIVDDAGSLSMEDLIADEDMVVTISNTDYIKRTPVSAYRAQRRGGRGKTGMATKDEDYVKDVFVASAHQPILFFTSQGRAFSLKTYELPQGTAATRGKPIINVLPVEKDEVVKAVLPVATFDDPDAYVLLATRGGKVKKTELSAYGKIRSSGIIGIILEDDDDLIDARLVYKDSSVLLATANGFAMHFQSEYDKESGRGVRPMGRVTRGVIGVRFRGDDRVVSLAILNSLERHAAIEALTADDVDDDDDAEELVDDNEATELPPFGVLTICENGYGKVTDPTKYPIKRRGGMGVIDIKVFEDGKRQKKVSKTGKVVGQRIVRPFSHIIVVTDGGTLIRTKVEQCLRQSESGPQMVGRNTMGVRIINLDEGEKVVGFDVLVDDSEDDDEQGHDAAVEGAADAAGDTESTQAQHHTPAQTDAMDPDPES